MSLVICGMEDVIFRFYPDVSTGLTELDAVVRGQVLTAVLTEVELSKVQEVLLDIEIPARCGSSPIDLGAALQAAIGRDPFQPREPTSRRLWRRRGSADS